MADSVVAAYYGMINVGYLLLFLYRYRQGQVVITDRRASINVVVLFMLVQPLCRVVSGMNGVLLFAASSMASIVILPTPAGDREEEARMEEIQEDEKRRETSNKSHKKKKTQ